MSFYLELDGNGKILKKEKKGRGRPRIGYTLVNDGQHKGNWVKTGTTKAEIQEQENADRNMALPIPKVEVDPAEDGIIETPVKKDQTRIYNVPTTTKEKILKSLHCLKVEEKDNMTIINCPIRSIVVDSGIEDELPFCSQWHRIEIDETANMIRVWPTYMVKGRVLPPRYIIHGALKKNI